ncbi:MAG TPA: hypothetical protein VNH82_09010, partial [Candidatus Dormibacteraeota bacterium]|nr:hypothetical protein [Candidatus Dormibacteraeota bacterium]
ANRRLRLCGVDYYIDADLVHDHADARYRSLCGRTGWRAAGPHRPDARLRRRAGHIGRIPSAPHARITFVSDRA